MGGFGGFEEFWGVFERFLGVFRGFLRGFIKGLKGFDEVLGVLKVFERFENLWWVWKIGEKFR